MAILSILELLLTMELGRNDCAFSLVRCRMVASTGLACLAVVAAYGQGTLTATIDSITPSGTVQRRITDHPETGFVELTVGQFNLTRTGGTFVGELMPINVPAPDTFAGFCLEPKETISTGNSYTWTVGAVETGNTLQGGLTSLRADLIRELFARHHPAFGTPLMNLQAGALQIAIWEIVRETSLSGSAVGLDLNTASGNVQFQSESVSGMIAAAQGYLATLTNLPEAPRTQTLRAMTIVGTQDLLVQVPEPARAGLAMAAALAGWVVGRRRRG